MDMPASWDWSRNEKEENESEWKFVEETSQLIFLKPTRKCL